MIQIAAPLQTKGLQCELSKEIHSRGCKDNLALLNSVHQHFAFHSFFNGEMGMMPHFCFLLALQGLLNRTNHLQRALSHLSLSCLPYLLSKAWPESGISKSRSRVGTAHAELCSTGESPILQSSLGVGLGPELLHAKAAFQFLSRGQETTQPISAKCFCPVLQGSLVPPGQPDSSPRGHRLVLLRGLSLSDR